VNSLHDADGGLADPAITLETDAFKCKRRGNSIKNAKKNKKETKSQKSHEKSNNQIKAEDKSRTREERMNKEKRQKIDSNDSSSVLAVLPGSVHQPHFPSSLALSASISSVPLGYSLAVQPQFVQQMQLKAQYQQLQAQHQMKMQQFQIQQQMQQYALLQAYRSALTGVNH
jgi:hypothetical protein